MDKWSDPNNPNHGPTGNPKGRPVGSMTRLARQAREHASSTGKLPHEILLDIARGIPQKIRVVRNGVEEETLVGITLEDIKDAAKAAAPYYAPKIATIEVTSGISDDDLNTFIERAAAEAGLSFGGLRTGAAEPREGREGSAARRKADIGDDEEASED